jgi:kynurenine formamidase
MDQHRVRFDAEIRFAGGGSLRTRGFDLDIAGDDISDADLATLLVNRLRLPPVELVRITNKAVRRKRHRGFWVMPAARRSVLVELSHPIRDGMVTCPGLPGPRISDHLTREASRQHYAPGVEFHIGQITMIANTGTYVDTPAHRYAGADDLTGVGLERLVNLPGLVIPVPATVAAVDRTVLAPYHVDGHAVLLRTGWDRHWGTDTYGEPGHPFLTLDGAAHLAQHGALLVGIDSVNIDDTADPRRPAHSTLLAHGVPVVEHLRGLEQLPPDGFTFHAAPPMVSGLATFPVRAYAILRGGA